MENSLRLGRCVQVRISSGARSVPRDENHERLREAYIYTNPPRGVQQREQKNTLGRRVAQGCCLNGGPSRTAELPDLAGAAEEADASHLHVAALLDGRLNRLLGRSLYRLLSGGLQIGRASCRKECRSRWSPD